MTFYKSDKSKKNQGERWVHVLGGGWGFAIRGERYLVGRHCQENGITPIALNSLPHIRSHVTPQARRNRILNWWLLETGDQLKNESLKAWNSVFPKVFDSAAHFERTSLSPDTAWWMRERKYNLNRTVDCGPHLLALLLKLYNKNKQKLMK